MIHPRVYVPMSGGLGDIIIYMLHKNNDFGFFKSAKALHGVHTSAYVWGVTDVSKLLFEGITWLDEIRFFPFHSRWDYRSKEIAMRAGEDRIGNENKVDLTWERPQFVLSEVERKTLDQIKAAGPYAAFHPFAGDPIRDFAINKLDPVKCIEAIRRGGLNVVILGGASRRYGHNTGMNVHAADESRPVYENMSGVYNLIDVGSPRLHAQATIDAARFVGATSAYNCAAHETNVKSFVCTWPGNQRFIDHERSGIFCHMREVGTEVYYFGKLPGDVYDRIERFSREGVPHA